MTNLITHLRTGSYLLLFLLFGCTDHRLPELVVSRLRVKTITETTGGPRLVSELLYDAQGKLSGIKTHKTDSTRLENTTYVYDGQNRLSQIQRVIHVYPTSEPPRTNTDSYSFSYTTGGQIAQIRYISSVADSLNFICVPTYNNAGQVVGNQVDSYNGFQSNRFTTQFSYTNNNLITARITFTSTSGLIQYYFTYDSHPNPFHGVIMPISTINVGSTTLDPVSVFVYPPKYDGVANLLSMSINNVLSDGYNDYVYTYNSAGLLTRRTAIRSGFPNQFVTGILDFEYESY